MSNSTAATAIIILRTRCPACQQPVKQAGHKADVRYFNQS